MDFAESEASYVSNFFSLGQSFSLCDLGPSQIPQVLVVEVDDLAWFPLEVEEEDGVDCFPFEEDESVVVFFSVCLTLESLESDLLELDCARSLDRMRTRSMIACREFV